MKKTIFLLVLVLLITSFSGTAFAAVSDFSDVQDPQLALELATLQSLNVVNGMGDGRFAPNDTLTRAQFCKMAVIIMDEGKLEPQYRNRTIFRDVKSNHWARGYINLAAAGEPRIIAGMGDGRFCPNETVTYGQALTILLRVLGYEDADAGMLWPDGYVALAGRIGLSDGITLAAGSPISRAQAAKLFYQMLAMNNKDGTAYLSRFGTLQDGALLLDAGAALSDGSPAVRSSLGTNPAEKALPAILQGRRGTLVMNEKGKVILFMPDKSLATQVSVAEAAAESVKDKNGSRYSIPASVPVYSASGTETSWASRWATLRNGTELTLLWSASGRVEAVYLHGATASAVMVAKNPVNGNPFTALTEGHAGYRVLKNGAAASVSDIRRYDVGEFDAATNTLRICDVKLSGYYEDAAPSVSAPESIKLLGAEFRLLPTAKQDIASFRIGDSITLLLAENGMVAGVVSATEAEGNAIGLVNEWSEGSVSVTMLDCLDSETGGALTLSGVPATRTNFSGQLVTVSSRKAGTLSLSELNSVALNGTLDLQTKRLGSLPLSPAVRVFERVNTSPLKAISLDDLRQDSLPSSKLLFAHKDANGRIDLIVLNNVTGECYDYGFLTLEGVDEEGEVVGQQVISIRNSAGTVLSAPCGYRARDKMVAGAAVSVSEGTVCSLVELKKIAYVNRAAFYEDAGSWQMAWNDQIFPVSENVQCYNKKTDFWFRTMEDTLAYAVQFSVYYDRAPEQGGKVRMIVIE